MAAESLFNTSSMPVSVNGKFNVVDLSLKNCPVVTLLVITMREEPYIGLIRASFEADIKVTLKILGY